MSEITEGTRMLQLAENLRVVDADSHMTERHDLFTERAPKGYEDKVPLFVNALQPIEWRYTNDPSWVMREKGNQLDYNRVWVKADGVLPDDPILHTATLLYSSDTTVLDSIITTHGLSWGYDRIFAATVNHSVWFHRQVDFNDWVLYSTSSPVATDSRGLGTGYFFDRSRRPVASVVQEGLVKYFPETH